MRNHSWRLAGIAGAASLPATVAGIMITLDRWDWQVMTMVFVLSLPLYVAARGESEKPARRRSSEASS